MATTMATTGWGLERPTTPKPEKRGRVAISPHASHAAHKGIVWLHAGAVGIWLIVILTLGAVILAGRNVPQIVMIIAAAAGLLHAAFLGTHVVLAGKARRRAAA